MTRIAGWADTGIRQGFRKRTQIMAKCGLESPKDDRRRRVRLEVKGQVQGVGFRPFIYRIAHEHELAGYVANDPDGAVIEVEGRSDCITRFERAIIDKHPPLAKPVIARRRVLDAAGDTAFAIRHSVTQGAKTALVTPDTAACADCLREIAEGNDRRYRYPFTNCTNCGPRYTIIFDIPYDRPNTTMGVFEMCPDCRREYEDPLNRRFHAQPNACPVCGPHVTLHDENGALVSCADPIRRTIELLKEGKCLAVKGLGGFHLAVDAANPEAVRRLRRRKRREQKPLAMMSPNVDTVERFCELTAEARAALTSPERPIVLLPKRPGSPVADEVAPKSARFGVMLPYTPLHHLLFADGDFIALVMTSGNVSEEPIVRDNDAAFARLAGIADSFLVHNRDIFARCDDSVVAAIDGETIMRRRSRGYVPAPIELPFAPDRDILAVGAELVNTVLYTKGSRAFGSQHIGDLKNPRALAFFEHAVEMLARLLDVEAEVVACDNHPGYLSTRYARRLTGVKVVPVQHHHAHIASVIAENKLVGCVLGLACDGTGLGSDGATWGCEFLLVNGADFKRAGHLKYLPLPGGDMAAREPWRMAVSVLLDAFGELPAAALDRLGVDSEKISAVAEIVRKRVASPDTSSLGRLFDAASALAGVCSFNTYEGQAPMELEGAVDMARTGVYPYEIAGDEALIVDPAPIIRAMARDVDAGADAAVISARFHRAVAAFLVEGAARIGRSHDLRTAALSGGVFQNEILFHLVCRGLRERGFEVFYNRLVPTNDGGVALGQAYVAALECRR